MGQHFDLEQAKKDIAENLKQVAESKRKFEEFKLTRKVLEEAFQAVGIGTESSETTETNASQEEGGDD